MDLSKLALSSELAALSWQLSGETSTCELGAATCELVALEWCERRDSNPHGFGPLDPKSSASANSATFA